MNRKLLLTSVLAFLVCILNLALNLQTVRASGTIRIRADGGVEGTASILTVDNVTYVFTADIINDSIVVERNDIVIDGNGHTLQGAGNATGIDLSGRTNVTVQNATIRAFSNGVYLGYYSGSNMISGNNITANTAIGIQLYYPLSGNMISMNNITENGGDGIGLGYSSGTTVSGNNIINNSVGIGLGHSSSNTVFGNSIADNYDYGIWLYYSSSNSISGNNFINNTNHVAFSGTSTNTWDNGYPSGGNYWGDYQTRYPGASEIDSSGIWDTPYVIDANNTDHYPLMHTAPTIPEFPSLIVLPLFMTALLLAISFCERRHTIKTN